MWLTETLEEDGIRGAVVRRMLRRDGRCVRRYRGFPKGRMSERRDPKGICPPMADDHEQGAGRGRRT